MVSVTVCRYIPNPPETYGIIEEEEQGGMNEGDDWGKKGTENMQSTWFLLSRWLLVCLQIPTWC